MKKAVVIGEILVEIMADRTDQSFLEAGSFQGPYPSGAPAIFIDQLAKMKVPSAILSGVGEDDFGTLCLNRLKEDGVDTSLVKRVREKATGVAFVRYNSDGSRNFIYHIDNAACGTTTRADLASLNYESIGTFHIMGSSIFNREMYEVHRQVLRDLPKECTISFDPNVRPEILQKDPLLSELMQEFFGRSALVFITEEELEFLTSADSLKESLEICFDKGIETVVLKRGEEGASLYTRDKEFHQPPLKVEAVDPTGAGDTFAGAFLGAWLKEWPLENCLKAANAAGASAVSKRGPMEGTISLDKIEEALRPGF